MGKILFIADVHLKLGQKKVPRKWAYDRFMQLASDISKAMYDSGADSLMIGGDLLDVANPSVDEVGLMYDFLLCAGSNGQHKTILFPGNHEMTTKKKDCFLPLHRMLTQLGVTVIRDDYRSMLFDVVPYNVLHAGDWKEPKAGVCFTHVRGAIEPHVEPEIDLEKFKVWPKVFAGDLHSVKNSQGNIYYPGSPISTSFHRNIPTETNGYFIIDTDTTEHEWHEFELPHLIRKTVQSEDEMVKTDYHHTIYEIEGDMEALANVKNSDLLDKKVNKNVSTEATLNLTGDIPEEVGEYLTEVENLQKDTVTRVVGKLKDIV